MDTFEKIRALLAEQLDIDPAKLEDEFGIEVPDDAIENLRTVGDVVEFVDSHKG